MKSLLLILCLALGTSALVAQASEPKKSEATVSAPAASSSESKASLNNVVLTKDNTVVLNTVVWGDTVAAVQKKAKEMDARVDSSEPLYLVLSTPGGSIDDGLEMIRTVSNLKRPVKTVTIFAASMGFQTVQGLGERLILEDGTLMSHKARGGFYGEFPGQLDSRYEYYMKRITRLDQKAADRTNGKHTLKSYRDLIENEYWCDGQDCVNQGFADRVVKAQCDKSLEGTNNQMLDQFIWGGHTIEIIAEYDNCPLNTNALKYNILVDGQPLFKGDQSKKETVKAAVDYYSSYYGYNSSTPALTRDELFEIKSRTDKVIEKRENMRNNVVKGY